MNVLNPIVLATCTYLALFGNSVLGVSIKVANLNLLAPSNVRANNIWPPKEENFLNNREQRKNIFMNLIKGESPTGEIPAKFMSMAKMEIYTFQEEDIPDSNLLAEMNKLGYERVAAIRPNPEQNAGVSIYYKKDLLTLEKYEEVKAGDKKGIAVVAKFSVRATNSKLVIGDIWTLYGDDQVDARKDHVQNVLEKTAEIADNGNGGYWPIIVAGEFNEDANGDLYKAIINENENENKLCLKPLLKYNEKKYVTFLDYNPTEEKGQPLNPSFIFYSGFKENPNILTEPPTEDEWKAAGITYLPCGEKYYATDHLVIAAEFTIPNQN